MGGIDKIDALVGFYRVFLHSNKWYLCIFFHLLNMAVVNAWILYRKELVAMDPHAKELNLYDFKTEISTCLREQDKPMCTRPPHAGWPLIPQHQP